MEIRAADDAADLAVLAAGLIEEMIAKQPHAVILAATGDTPMGCYAELGKRYRSGSFDPGQVRVAQLDEYVGVGPDDRRSLYGWMKRSFCDPLDIGPERVIRLRGDATDPVAACAEYDAAVEAAGGVDLAVLGLGPNGHLGFNEPPTELDAPTRLVELAPESIVSNARYWGPGEVPARAVTAGMSLIMTARRVLLLVAGQHKADILQRFLDGHPDPWLPASWLHRHPDALVVADRAALAGVPARP